MPINIRQGESEEQFISRCIGTEIGAGKEQEQAAAICYSYWRKDKMSKLKGQDKIIETLKYNRDFRGVNLLADSLEDACWEGYVAIGTKMLDGREVPNCVPESENMESVQPTISSTYPGEGASTGSVELQECPPATQSIPLNLYNRWNAIQQAKYGPLNPQQPNEEYWTRKANQFGGSVEEAKTALCGNCAFFDVRKKTLDCIAQGIGYKDDPEKVIEAGELGYCEAFDFKCASSRTCDAWVVGGPIKD
jgi:hypothetical protein